MNDLPLVTIILPTRNRPALLQRAVKSVLAQSYRNWELLVVNDAGEDVAEALSGIVEDDDGRVWLFNHPFRMGPGAARNTALRIAGGKYVFYLDDDDLYHPGHVHELVAFLEENSLDFAFSRGMMIFEDERCMEVGRNDHYANLDISEEFLYVTNAVPLIGICHSLQAIEDTGFFDEGLSSFEDWDFILRFIRDKRCGELASVTYEIRRRISESESVTLDNQADHIANYGIIYDRFPVEEQALNDARREVLQTLRNAGIESACVPGNTVESSTPGVSRENSLVDLVNNRDMAQIRRQYSLGLGDEGYLPGMMALAEEARKEKIEEQIVTAYVEHLAQTPGDADAHVQLAYLLYVIDEKDTALYAIENAVSLDHGRYDALYLEAKLLAESGSRDEAKLVLESLETQVVANQEILYQVLRLYSQLAGLDDAIRYAESCLAGIRKASARVLNHVGNLHYRNNALPKAQEYYQDAVDRDEAYPDARTNLDLVKVITTSNKPPLYLVLPRGENYGWGVCSDNLRRELPAKTAVFNLEYEDWAENGNKYIPGPVFTSIGAESLELIYPVKGKKNIGYTFFERDLTENAKANAAFFDLVLAGSTWATEQLKAHGIRNTDVLVQGIDDSKFYPVGVDSHKGFFVFSGGKFELRKGQDLVLKAIRILQEKYEDIFLVNAWVNFWPQSMYTMSYSSHIRYEYQGNDWQSLMQHIYDLNGLNPEKIITCDIVPHDELRALYARTDIGLFPNRSEGGTNLVLMEYMACGKPVIASNCTGHKDIVNTANSLLLEKLGRKEYLDDHGHHFATWDEPDLDELVEKIEYAYHNRKEIQRLGQQAGVDLKNFTWERMAANLVDTLGKWSLLD